MTSQICYASLAIYTKSNRENEISEFLGTSPTLVGERRGTFSWIYSTKDSPGIATVEEHLQCIREKFEQATHALTRLSSEDGEIRVWIYLGLAEINHAFVLPEDFIKWLASFSADICVDTWADSI